MRQRDHLATESSPDINGFNLIGVLGGVFRGTQLLLYTTEMSPADMARNIAHELGHKPGGLSGVAEIKNLLFDGGSNEHRLRYRALKKFLAPTTRESQWKTFKR